MLNINRLILGPVQTNCYIVSNEDTKEAIVIDPSDNADEIIACLNKEGVKLKGIFLTHGHFDHMMAADELRASTSAKLYAHEDEQSVLQNPADNLSTMFTGVAAATSADVLLKDNDEVTVAGIKMKVFHTPGHTKGGCCYYLPEQMLLFSGDTLFHSTIGRTDFPTGDYNTLVNSVRQRLFVLDDEVKVLPGHNDITTIGYEKKHNYEV